MPFLLFLQESLIDKLSMKCSVAGKKCEVLQAQLASGSNDGEVFGSIDFDQLQIENSQLQEKIDSRNSELLALKQATAMTLTRLNALKLQLSEVLTETTWLKGQKQQKMLAIDKVKPCAPIPFARLFAHFNRATHLKLRTYQREFTRRIQVKGELDNVNSHVSAEDALKRRLSRELKLGSAVPPVLDYVTNVMKLEKLRLKEKNESKRVQVSGRNMAFERGICVVERALLTVMNTFPIQHSSRRMQNVDCLCSDELFNFATRCAPCLHRHSH